MYVIAIVRVNDKFVYVRGLGERYSSTLLNGSVIPSPDFNEFEGGALYLVGMSMKECKDAAAFEQPLSVYGRKRLVYSMNF